VSICKNYVGVTMVFVPCGIDVDVRHVQGYISIHM
jgi:hypothetical protein